MIVVFCQLELLVILLICFTNIPININRDVWIKHLTLIDVNLCKVDVKGNLCCISPFNGQRANNRKLQRDVATLAVIVRSRESVYSLSEM